MATRQIPWARIVAEGFAIVVSILLAFGIQAWWEGWQERGHEREILVGLRADFQATLQEVRRVKQASMEDRDAASRLLAVSGPRATVDEVPVDSLLASLIATEAYRPTEATLTSLFNSQGLGPVTDPALRLRLTEWAEVDADITRALGEREAVYADRLMPYLESRIPVRSLDATLQQYYGPGSSRFPLDAEALLRDLEFENHMAALYFLANQAVISLERAEAAAQEILTLLHESAVALDAKRN